MPIAESALNRPALFTGPASLDPVPQLYRPAGAAADPTPRPADAEAPLPSEEPVAVVVPRAPVAEAQEEPPAAAQSALGPGQVALPRDVRLSFPRLFKLEEDLGRLLGQRDVQIDIQENGQIIISVTPDQVERVRDFVMLSAELNGGGSAHA